MFSRIVAVSTLAFAVLAAAADSCNTGSMQCCNQVEDSKSASGSALLTALGINLQDVTGQIGLGCSPLSVVGVGAGNSCTASPVCCQNNNVERRNMASTEETPLLATHLSDQEISKHELLYQRFSPSQKRTIVGLISYAAVIPFLASGSFIPSIPEISKDLGTSGSVISFAVSLSLAATALGGLIWATYSSAYGRRFVFLRSLPCLCLGSIGVAISHSVPTLMFWRVVQAFGASSGMSIGAGVIGDIYRLEERGYAMGIFVGASMVGPAIAPLFGGLATHYASWRYAQWFLAVMGVSAFVPVALWLPETLDPDQLNKTKGGVNPLASLTLLRSPNVLLPSIAGATGLICDFVMMVPVSYTIGKAYNISNEAIIGSFFIPLGIGNILGSPLAGYLSDRAVVLRRARRGGVWVPEDRLHATLWGAAVLVPVSVVAEGLTIRYVPGVTGIILVVFWLFVNGIGLLVVLTPSASYFVDILHDRSAESMAASSSFRALVAAFATAGMLPLINAVGVVATNALFALVGWLGFASIVLTIRYGDRMRAWADIGYTTSTDRC
ncbi:MFS general substrate transporter [Ganoderma sinense ZZ0214-1]|uniref:MFS general substrate transporter n=1 Tax=Ganoderma sinense ZZ0214-1 TaxID=1077348 RepID=A0A2G8SHC4_9APHY|nr:MFS general substrate transporter [Ganoderma sinense ZZ0214-1]